MFEVNIVTSFDGVTLEVGGDVETYWKSTAVSSAPQTSSPWPHRSNLIGSAHTSPSTQSISTSFGQASTISSLRGNYLHLVIQVTRDLHPVIFPNWLLPDTGFDLSVSDVTLDQFEALAVQLKRNVSTTDGSSVHDWPAMMSRSMISLAQLLTVRYPTHSM